MLNTYLVMSHKLVWLEISWYLELVIKSVLSLFSEWAMVIAFALPFNIGIATTWIASVSILNYNHVANPSYYATGVFFDILRADMGA